MKISSVKGRKGERINFAHFALNKQNKYAISISPFSFSSSYNQIQSNFTQKQTKREYSARIEGKATKEGTANFLSKFNNSKDDNDNSLSPPSIPPSLLEEQQQKDFIKTSKKLTKGQSTDQQITPKLNSKTDFTLHPFVYSTQRLNPFDMGHQQVLSSIFTAGVNVFTANTLQPISEIILSDVFENLNINNETTQKPKEFTKASAVASFLSSNVPSHCSIARDNFVIATKGGFVLEDNNKTNFPNPVDYSLDPTFIRNQIMESLERMRVECIDLFLIERPEVLFRLKKYSKEDIYAALIPLFQELESLSRLGYIQYYGICSEVLSNDDSSPHSLSLQKILQCAEKAGGGNNKFGVVEYPYNLVESDSLLNKIYPSLHHNKPNLSLIDFANENGLITIGSRPLTAKLSDKMKRRLISYPSHDDKDIASLINEAINYAARLERDYEDGVEFRNNLPPPSDLQWTRIIAGSQHQLDSIDRWKDAMDYHIKPKIQQTLQKITQNTKVHLHFSSFPTRYHIATSKLFERIEWSFETKARHQIEPLIDYLEEMDEMLGKSDLQTNALRFALSAPQSCVTVGLRADHLLGDLFSTLYYPPIERARLNEFLTNIKNKKSNLFKI